MTEPTRAPSARVCRCGTPFPPDRASQARYHSDECANAHRQRRHRAFEFPELSNAADREALALVALRNHGLVPEPIECDHRGQQPWHDDDGELICWRCGDAFALSSPESGLRAAVA